jgi:hypothetical protein
VKVNSEGQLGCNPGEVGEKGEKGDTGATGATGAAGTNGTNGTNGAIATFVSFKNVARGNCLKYTDLAAQGTAAGPAATAGFSTSQLLDGPTPASGATVTNLYAETSATVTGADTVLVAVIDNTTATTLLSCTVTSAPPKGCSNTSGSGSAAAGDNIEVKLTATGSSGNLKPWRVTFRY